APASPASSSAASSRPDTLLTRLSQRVPQLRERSVLRHAYRPGRAAHRRRGLLRGEPDDQPQDHDLPLLFGKPLQELLDADTGLGVQIRLLRIEITAIRTVGTRGLVRYIRGGIRFVTRGGPVGIGDLMSCDSI